MSTESVQPSQGLCECAPAMLRGSFYADVEPSLARSLENSLLPHAMQVFNSPVPPAAWAESEFAGKLAFLRCTQDQAMPVVMQDMLVQRSGVDWMVKDIEASHSSWASRPEEVVKILDEWVAVFQGAHA